MGRFSDLIATGELKPKQEASTAVEKPKPAGRFANLVATGVLAPKEKPEEFNPATGSKFSIILDEKGNLPKKKRQSVAESAKAGILDLFTGASKQTRETEDLPELTIGSLMIDSSLGSPLNRAKIIGQQLLSLNTKDRVDTIRSTGLDVSEDSKGNPIVTTKEGDRIQLNKPGVSLADIAPVALNIVAFGKVGRAAQLAKGIAKKLAVSALAEGGLETVRQRVSKELGAEDAIRPGQIILAATTGVLGEALTHVPKLSKAIKEARLTKKALPAKLRISRNTNVVELADTIKQADEATAGLGLKTKLLPAQRSLAYESLALQEEVTRRSATSFDAGKVLKNQSEEIRDAVTKIMDDIAPLHSVETGAKKVIEASSEFVANLKQNRKDLTKGIYRKARDEIDSVSVKKTQSMLRGLRKQYGNESKTVRKQVERIDQLLKGKKRKVILDGKPTVIREKMDLMEAQEAKFAIDALLEKRGTNALTNNAKRVTQLIKKTYLDELNSQSKFFKLANDTYEALSKPINDVLDGMIGNLSNISSEKTSAVVRKIFDTAEINPSILLKTKAAIQKVDKQAWNEIVRTEIERSLKDVDFAGAIKAGDNLPGQLYTALFGKGKSGRLLIDAVDGKNKSKLIYLRTVLDRARRGRPSGSKTAFATGLQEELKDEASGVLRAILGSIRSTVAKAGSKKLLDRHLKNIATMILDPEFDFDFARLAKIDSNSKAAEKIMNSMLKKSSDEFYRGLSHAARQELQDKQIFSESE